jgi:hypothetical protein
MASPGKLFPPSFSFKAPSGHLFIGLLALFRKSF